MQCDAVHDSAGRELSRPANIPFHMATAADYALNTDHTIGDNADIQWFDTCNVVTTR